MTVCGNPLSRSLLGVKRTCPIALHMSANDPKQTLVVAPHIGAGFGMIEATNLVHRTKRATGIKAREK